MLRNRIINQIKTQRLIVGHTACLAKPHTCRSLSSQPKEAADTNLPSDGRSLYSHSISKLLNPVGYMKWRMKLIDSARMLYENCSNQFETNEKLITGNSDEKHFETNAILIYKIETDVGLEVNFQAWFNMTILHVWMLNARLRGEGEIGKELRQEIFNHIWLDVELKLHQAGVKSNASKISEDLLHSYYGHTLAYDEGVAKSDAVLAAALWRNFLNAKEDVDPTALLQLVEYVRNNLVTLDTIAFDPFLLQGKFKFLTK